MAKRKHEHWTMRELEFLEEVYEYASTDDIAQVMGRTRNSINQRLQQMGKSIRGVYAYYKGDEIIATGTAEEIAEELNIQANTVYVRKSRPTKNIKVVRLVHDTKELEEIYKEVVGG